MTSPKSFGKLKKRKLLVIRRVQGRSMMPFLNPGQIVIGHGLFRRIKERDIVIIHHAGKEKIKRVMKVGPNNIFVVGDNEHESTDSRHFGELPLGCVVAKCFRN